MKLRNIFLLISCCFAAFSCSMEDDTIMNDVENNMDSMKEATTEAYTSINLNFSSEEMETKSKSTITVGGEEAPNGGDPNSTYNEKYIHSFDVFVVDEAGKIIHIISEGGQVSGENTDDITLKDIRFITKYKNGRKLTAYAVINARKSSDDATNFFSDVKIGGTVNDFLNKEISEHLAANALVKVGSKEIVMNENFYHQVSPKDFPLEKDFLLNIPVHHIAARLDFSKFSCTLKDFSVGATVKLVSAEFRNMQTKGYINGEEYSTFSPAEAVALEIGNGITVPEIDSEQRTYSYNPELRAYSYRSQSLTKDGHEQHVELFVKFEVNDNGVAKTFEKTYTINRPVSGKNVDHNYVKGGYLYNIEVNWTITPSWADSSIEFYTRDWEHESLEDVVL